MLNAVMMKGCVEYRTGVAFSSTFLTDLGGFWVTMLAYSGGRPSRVRTDS